MSLTEIKKRYNIPLKQDELEYWGPVNHQLSDAFLSMGQDFLESYLKKVPRIKRKKIFTAFIELIQNIADYNEKNAKQNAAAFVKLSVEKNQIFIFTISELYNGDDIKVIEILDHIFNIKPAEIKERYKVALMNNKSLGLIMLRAMADSALSYEVKTDNLKTFINFNFRMKY